jgi:hypothetical protein
MWKDFNTKFEGILKSLRRHKELVESRASLTQYHMYQEDVSEIKAKVEELVEEEKRKKKANVRDWLAVDTRPEHDHDTYRLVKGEYAGTGDWIAEHEAIKHWLDADVPSTPLLWMAGIPGAGKFPIPPTAIFIKPLIYPSTSKLRTCTVYFLTHSQVLIEESSCVHLLPLLLAECTHNQSLQASHWKLMEQVYLVF